ncbi:UNVERIFIED_CONTAM: hypothetical protein Sradi_5842900 [Sesamum radiatum]|uniref:Uncharacterized protein n=1 Tax=Sesamum radiatum TaxID=300843 RepID=A0AAW2KS44_SESRA
MYDNTTDKAFIMRAALMCSVNCLPAYRMGSGWSTTGIMGCPICMDGTRTFYLQHGGKACYFNYHRQFLSKDHPYGRNKKAFTKNRVEYMVARPKLKRGQICDWVADISLSVEQTLTLPFGYGSDHKCTKESIFYTGKCI